MDEAGDQLLTVEEAAQRLGVSVATVRRRCASGALPARKVGKSWLVAASNLPQARPQRRRPRRASVLVDLPRALTHVRSQDLKRDVWVPDVLRHEDDLAQPVSLIAAAAARLELEDPFDPPSYVPVPKNPIFPRNAVDLSLVDRLAYQAVAGACAVLIERQLSPSVYSARLANDKKFFLVNGRDAWLRWRHDVIRAIDEGSAWMAETDVTAFFDFIKHELLLPELQHLGVDHVLVAALREMLRTWSVTPNTGLPQGPNASRLFANFYMVPVDVAMDAVTDVRYFRYMDDIRIVGSSRASVIKALQELDSECRRRGLALSTKKTELLQGTAAIDSMADSELDALQYDFTVQPEDDDTSLRTRLRDVLKAALARTDAINVRHAKFSLGRLFQLRDSAVLKRVLDNLEHLGPLRDIAPKYLHPWLRRASVERRLTAFLRDPERNTSPFLSAWLMAVMLDLEPPLPSDWIDYARSIAVNRSEPTFHRCIGLNLLALSGHVRDIARIEDVIRTEYDPEVVRAALVALARAGRLTKAHENRARRIPGIAATIEYLRGRRELPSLVFESRRRATIAPSS